MFAPLNVDRGLQTCVDHVLEECVVTARELALNVQLG